MLVVSVRMKYLKIASVIVLAAVIISLIILAVMSIKAKKSSANIIGTNEERVAFLNRNGWIVSEEPVIVTDIIIPSEFNEVYNEYNALQIKQGYDLSKYKGVTAKKYTYDVKNYPDVLENVQANMLIYNDRIIGGDVSSNEINGFTQGLIDTG